MKLFTLWGHIATRVPILLHLLTPFLIGTIYRVAYMDRIMQKISNGILRKEKFNHFLQKISHYEISILKTFMHLKDTCGKCLFVVPLMRLPLYLIVIVIS